MKRRRYESETPPRDFTTAAIVTMVLYLFLYVPGLVANFAYLKSADAERDRIGADPQGRGCLVALLWVFLGVPVAAILFLAAMAVLGFLIRH